MKKQRVVWSRGIFLTPQHFQAQDDCFEAALEFRFKASHFANWGLVGISVDEAALANGMFTLRHCEGVLPDGLIVNMPEMDDLPPGRPVEPQFPPAQEELDVFLAVPEARPRGQNFTLAAAEPAGAQGQRLATRYVAATQVLPDATAAGDEQPVQLAGKTLRVLFGGESLDGFTAMRIARLRRNPSGICVLDPQFIPPLLDISASEFLMMMVRRQIELLAAKSASLALPRRQKGRDFADFIASDVGSFWLLQLVNSYLPDLKHIWKVRRGHPEVLFRAMLRMAGTLLTFAPEGGAGDLPDYDHDNLSPCFIELDARVRDLLETVLPTKCVSISLEPSGRLIWSGTIPKESYFRDSQWFLAVSAKMAVDELIGKLPRLAKVSAPAEMERLVQRSLPGLSLRHNPAPPSAISVKLESQYFSLGQAGPMWEGIVQSRTLSVFVPGEIVQPKMELLIVLQ